MLAEVLHSFDGDRCGAGPSAVTVTPYQARGGVSVLRHIGAALCLITGIHRQAGCSNIRIRRFPKEPLGVAEPLNRLARGIRLAVALDMKRRGSRESGTAITVVPEGTACETSPALTVPASGVDLEALERAVIAFALERKSGNQVQSARFLGLSRSALIYRMQKYGLTGGAHRRMSAASAHTSHATG
jgi:hypothetical protein